MERTNIHGVELISKDDMVVRANSKSSSGFEHETFEAFRNILEHINESREGPWVFVDVGAYTGIYSIYAAKKGFFVEAFEPNPFVFTRLTENVNHNYESKNFEGGGIRYNLAALSDKVGEEFFNVNPAVKLTSGGSLESTVTRNKERYKVTIKTYDGDDYPIPDVIKIDVEGHEMNVLRGMEETLKRGNPWLIIESNTDAQTREICDYIENLGFKFHGLFDERNLIFSTQ